MSIYSIPTFIGSIISLMIGLFVWLKSRKSETHITFALYNLAVFIWLISYTIVYSLDNPKTAGIWCRVACVAVMFIAPTFYHFTLAYLGLKNEKRTVWITYSVMLFFAFLFKTEYFLRNIPFKYYWGYYSRAGVMHPIYLLFFFAIIMRGFFLIWRAHRNTNDMSAPEVLRMKYIFAAYLVNAGSGIDYIPKYGIELYPFGWLFAILYSSIIAYAILKHRLMDIRVALTRAGIFIFVYSFIFALPIWFGLTTQLWLWSVVLMGVLSPAGMLIYSHLREQAETALLKEEKRYQSSIRELAKKMLQIRDTDKLLETVIKEVDKIVRPEFVLFYKFSETANSYILQADSNGNKTAFAREFSPNTLFIQNLSSQKQSRLIEEAASLNIPFETLALPFYLEDKLFGFLLVGPKPKRAFYNQSDLTAFDILSSQTSLALENAKNLQDLKRSQMELLRQENLKFVSKLVKGLAHEILNPLTPLIHRIEDLEEENFLELYELYDRNKDKLAKEETLKFKKALLELRSSTKSLKENAKHIHLIISTLHKIQKGDETSIGPMDIKSFLKDIIPMLSIEVEPRLQEKVKINQNIDKGIPPLKGNPTLLKQVFINLYKNACQAMENSPIKQITISCKLNSENSGEAIIEFSDTGPGIPAGKLSKIFEHGFTTKGSTGSGIGLSQCKTIIEKFGGSVNIESEQGKGAKFIIKLPVCKEV